TQVLTTDAGRREAFALFLQTTIPDFAPVGEVPAAAASDKQFLVQPGSLVSPTLHYQDWEGNNHSARVSGGWFVDRKGSEAERLTLDIQYVDWAGKGWTASRVGGNFLHTRNGDTAATPSTSNEIKYLDWSDSQLRARINNAGPSLSFSPATAKPAAAFVMSQFLGSYSDPDDAVSLLRVELISPNPSNGVTLSIIPFGGLVSVLPSASCEATDTSFSFRVTDPGGATATATMEVTIIPNKAPLLAYLPPPSIVAGSSFSHSPLSPPLDPDGNFAPSLGAPTVSPEGFTGSVTVDQAGRFQITNASPPGIYQIRVTVSDGCATINSGFQLHVTDACPVITALVSGGGEICPSVSPTVSVSVTGGNAPYTVKLSDGQQKTSLTSPITFAVNPIVTTNYTAMVTDVNGCAASVAGSANVSPDVAPTFTTTTLPAGTTGSNYAQAIGVQPAGNYAFSLTKGSLPSGFVISPTTGIISGLTSSPGTSQFTVSAKLGGGCSATQAYTLVIACPTLTFGPSSLPNGQKGTPYNQAVNATPVVGTYTYSASGSLPPGVSLNPNTGILSGTPTANGTYNFMILATGMSGCGGSKSYSITIAPAACATINLPELPGGNKGKPYVAYVTPTPSGIYGHVLTGTLPPGLTFYSAIGLIYGYPTTTGTFNFTVTATNADNCVGSRAYAVAIGQ
ncbi:MAG: putative Ig domain-containing protein, partial [Acidobacteriota bacterium]